jgi:rusticyanin
MTRRRISILIGAAVAAVGLGAGLAVAATSSDTSAQPAAVASSGAPSYSYYQSMMGRYLSGTVGGSMMGGTGGYGWMMGQAGYQWMFGGTSAPGWMGGAALPAAMMGTGTDMGQVMGRLWASAPGPRVSTAQAAALGSRVPAGARIDRAATTITFTTTTVRLTMLASPSGGPDKTFRAAGLTNPRIIVPAGAQVAIQVINADPDAAHGLVITASQAAATWMPMMTARPAFTGSALWFLGNPTTAGMHVGTLTFSAAPPGTYRYLCPVPGHAQEGMTGIFTVGSPS